MLFWRIISVAREIPKGDMKAFFFVDGTTFSFLLGVAMEKARC